MTGAKAPTISLRNGADIPVLGIGTSPLRGEDSVRQIRAAIEAGYRLIDTAENYGNEEAVGEGLRASGIDREEVFLTTKFNRRWHSIDGVRQAYDASRKRLGVDYLDLMLVHWPNPDQDRYVDAVQGLQKLLESGDLRAIGVSNYKPKHLQRVLDETGIVPDVNQIQLSPYSTRDDCRAYHDEHGIVTESWSPLGASGGELRNDPTIARIAAAHDKSSTQVVLRWHIQLGLVVIPRSSNPGRIAENIEVFDFELSNEEMTTITGLNRGDAEVTDSDVFGH
ncbi:MAG TPA: aldo/keto reductase [Propionibacteriaceae bacterium]|nr:aldo/keto reductase [Propionibacteriaceae bacterium]